MFYLTFIETIGLFDRFSSKIKPLLCTTALSKLLEKPPGEAFSAQLVLLICPCSGNSNALVSVCCDLWPLNIASFEQLYLQSGLYE